MRVTYVLIASLALLCGIPIGVIFGVLLCYVDFTRQQNNSADPDYSGGM